MDVKVGDLMAAEVVVAPFEADLGDVRDLMTTHGISALPVVNTDRHLLGIVTSTDLLPDFPPETPVARAMSTRVQTISPHASPQLAARLMRDYRIHHLVVVEEERVAGILSTFDLLRLIRRRFAGPPPA